jgi:hypothetical protein
MLTITNKQMEAFSAYMMDSFIKKVKNHLRQKFPVSTDQMTDDTLHDIITQGIEKAAGYNIVERDDVLPFIEYMISLGKDFDKNPDQNWALKILKIRNLEGTEKIARLIDINPLYPEIQNG